MTHKSKSQSTKTIYDVIIPVVLATAILTIVILTAFHGNGQWIANLVIR